MKFYSYLNEVTKDPKEVVNIIEKECSQYIRELKNFPVLFRGAKIYTNQFLISKTPRTDRRPRDMPNPWHEYLDLFFEKKFGWKPRTQGVFATGAPSEADKYGEVYMFFPVNGYKYIWHPNIHDIVLDMEKHGLVSGPDPWKTLNGPETELGQEYIKGTLDKYINKYLSMVDNEEVVFNCKKYYLLNFFEPVHDWPSTKQKLLTTNI